MKPKAKKALTMFLVIITLIVFCIWQNNGIMVTKIKYSNSKIPNDFDGYTIVQISDLHNKEFGINQSKLLNKTKKAKPDIIVITGDLIDRNHTNIELAMEYISGAVKIAPVYFVSGNHEKWSGTYKELSDKLTKAGVTILDNKKVSLDKNNKTITLIGISDPAFYPDDYWEGKRLKTLMIGEQNNFNILLSHRPELMDLYVDNHVDLAFSGHAHGGQFRLPFIGGLIAPDQGLFPEFTEGNHEKEATSMIVSRGLGNSIIPLRIFNRPEVVVVTLKK
ncbi:metallophosphoesterase [Clostridium lacusfryxellense]|uniref:metallophosphoesterase n=1 Tax=Clostridium lacusfryxellense TaxID=205328 RepID=UPI001C0CEFDA|nr:metallophosphoesterase [Clostridium lacusfryxellense]MBU3110212.1 metallophosphoesterase [Clostridium lacusfryxellense]